MSCSGSKVRNWRFLASVLFPLILSPIAFQGETEIEAKKFKCGYTILVMGFFWMLEILPLPITALLPVAFFPFLGISSTGEVVRNYMKETQMMFIGGICIALGLRHSGLHHRIALKIMLLIGTSLWRLLLGILVTTMLLSCVISVNTAVAAMMIPIVAGLLDGLEGTLDSKEEKKLKVGFMLAVGYGANIGGTATIIGSQPSLIYRELMKGENVGQDGKYLDLNFFSFFIFSFPVAVLTLLVTWVILGSLHIGFQKSRFPTPPLQLQTNSDLAESPDFKMDELPTPTPKESTLLTETEPMSLILRKKYEDLGPLSFHEGAVLALLLLAISLWFTRDPQIFPSWISLLPENAPKIGDSSVAIAVLLLMFIIPRKLEYFKTAFEGEAETVLSWPYVQKNFPWNVIFIVGGGLAISDGANQSGLSAWLGSELMGLQNLSHPLILFILLITLVSFTEVMSNAATVSLLTPILVALSKQLDVHPLYLSFPGAIACQYAFMLPTANPPNAVVYSAGEMRMCDMVKAGIFLNCACVVVLYVMTITWGEYIFNFSEYSYENVTRI